METSDPLVFKSYISYFIFQRIYWETMQMGWNRFNRFFYAHPLVHIVFLFQGVSVSCNLYNLCEQTVAAGYSCRTASVTVVIVHIVFFFQGVSLSCNLYNSGWLYPKKFEKHPWYAVKCQKKHFLLNKFCSKMIPYPGDQPFHFGPNLPYKIGEKNGQNSLFQKLW